MRKIVKRSSNSSREPMSLQMITNKLDSFVSTLMFKSKERSIFDISPRIEVDVLQNLPLPVDFIIQGIGTRYYADGSKYQGAFVAGRRHGKGSLVDKSGILLYAGYWKYDRRDGEGTGQDLDGNSYTGNWRADKYHGTGTLKMKEIEYSGDWVDGKQEGQGDILFPNGDKYTGQWKDNKRNGNGIYIWIPNSASYEGSWIYDKPDGKGTMIFMDGSKYIGDFRAGKREGKGKMIYANNSSYEGEWKNDIMHGKGIYSIDQGTKFEGQFKSGYRIESGTRHWPDGTALSADEDKNSTSSFFESASNSFYKDSIQRYLQQYQAMPTPTDSIALMDVRANPSMVKAIEQIKRKNSDVR